MAMALGAGGEVAVLLLLLLLLLLLALDLDRVPTERARRMLLHENMSTPHEECNSYEEHYHKS